MLFVDIKLLLNTRSNIYSNILTLASLSFVRDLNDWQGAFQIYNSVKVRVISVETRSKFIFVTYFTI